MDGAGSAGVDFQRPILAGMQDQVGAVGVNIAVGL